MMKIMAKQKKDAPAVTGQSASTNTSEATITQSQQQKQVFPDGGKRKKSFSPKHLKCIPLDAKVNSMAIKVYDEQLPLGWQATVTSMCATSKKDFQIIGICHNRDIHAEKGDFWQASIEKPHYHIIFRCVDRNKRIRVQTVLGTIGIVFRPHLDNELYANHGVETIGNFAGYATYLTHETESAIKDAKELYSMDELVSNLTIDEIMQIRNGYIRLTDSNKKVTTKDLVELDNIAYKLGYELMDFKKWYKSLPFSVRSHTKMSAIRESYNLGVDTKIEEKSEVVRLCIYIQGSPNTGKTYGSKKALAGKRIHAVEGGGTGKFDDLRADHDAIIISDDICPNLLNMSDNYICKAYKRQSNNPAWAGNYFIVTSNLSFLDWLATCKIDTRSKHYDALTSRFYVCEVLKNNDGDNYLALQSPSTRGAMDEQQKRLDMFLNFQHKFNEIMAGYRPQEIKIDYDRYIDKSYALATCAVTQKSEQDAEQLELEAAERMLEWRATLASSWRCSNCGVLVSWQQTVCGCCGAVRGMIAPLEEYVTMK